jgi:hypothetical protein
LLIRWEQKEELRLKIVEEKKGSVLTILRFVALRVFYMKMYTVSKIVISQNYTDEKIKIEQCDRKIEHFIVSCFKEVHEMSVHVGD